MKKVIAVILLILLTFIALPALAQDEVTPSPETIEVSVGVFENSTLAPVLESMLMIIASSVGLITVLTSVTKRFVKKFPANTIAGVYIVLIWGAFSLVGYFGLEADWQPYIDGLTDVGFALLGLTGTAVASGFWYKANKSARVPIIGDTQNPSPETNPDWQG